MPTFILPRVSFGTGPAFFAGESDKKERLLSHRFIHTILVPIRRRLVSVESLTIVVIVVVGYLRLAENFVLLFLVFNFKRVGTSFLG